MAIAPAETLRRESVPTLGFCITKKQVKLCVWVKENLRTLHAVSKLKYHYVKNLKEKTAYLQQED